MIDAGWLGNDEDERVKVKKTGRREAGKVEKGD
jgi:hypothetical protein